MFKELTDKLAYPRMEEEILSFWKEHGIFGKSVSEGDGGRRFTFYEGPPTANGRPGIHHVLQPRFRLAQDDQEFEFLSPAPPDDVLQSRKFEE